MSMDLDFRDGLLVFQIAKLDPSEHDAARAEMRTAGMGATDIARVFKQARALCELIDQRVRMKRKQRRAGFLPEIETQPVA